MLSIWEKNSWQNYNYIIVGAGILGLSTAINIKQKHPLAQILVLEKGLLPTGASTKNAGFACFGSLTEIQSDIQQIGQQQTLELIHMRLQGLQMLRQQIPDALMDLQHHGEHELLENDQPLQTLDQINNLVAPILGPQAFILQNQKINTFGFSPQHIKNLIYCPKGGQLDSGKLMRQIWALAQTAGIHIITGAQVTHISNGTVQVAQPSTLQATHEFYAPTTIICANAYLNQLQPHTTVSPGRGQIVVTKPIPNLPFKGIFHIDEGYYYFRNINNRVLLGGGRNLNFQSETTHQLSTTPQIQNALLQKLQTIILPNTPFQIDYSWAGLMGFTPNKLPFIHQLNPNTYALHTCNGMGVALASYMAHKFVTTHLS